jgi:predicted enzyme related to lactoylglutathione lyase
LYKPGPPQSPEDAETVANLVAKGVISGVGLHVDNCRKTFEELSAKGVTFLQEPSDRPYGIEAVLRDNSGNWLVLVEPKEYSPEALA